MTGSSWRVALAALLALVTSCTSVAPSAPAATADPVAPPRFVELGAAAGRRPTQTPLDALEGVEEIAGRQIDILRTYASWDSEFPDLREVHARSAGRTVHLSINARREDGTIVPWSTIASAEPGTPIHDELVEWIGRIVAFDGSLRVTFHHEADIEPEFGEATDFTRAWRRFAELMHQADPNIPLVWVMTLSTLRTPRAEEFWPGDNYVDWIGADAFNWFGCRGTPEAWRSPAELLDPLIHFGEAHPGKPLMFAEIGSDEDPNDPDRKARWINEFADLVAQETYSPVEAVVFFHNDHDDESSCEWWLDSSPASATAFSALATSSLFGGDTAAAPAPRRCPVIDSMQGSTDDRALVDGDGDGRFDFVFGADNRFLGIGDQSEDGSDHRVVFTFDAVGAIAAEATVELRVKVGSRQPGLPSGVQLVVLVDEPATDRDAFSAPGTVVDPAWFDARTVDGHYMIDVTSTIDVATASTFRLQLEAAPPDADGKTPLFVGMSDARRSIDRPVLLVRSC